MMAGRSFTRRLGPSLNRTVVATDKVVLLAEALSATAPTADPIRRDLIGRRVTIMISGRCRPATVICAVPNSDNRGGRALIHYDAPDQIDPTISAWVPLAALFAADGIGPLLERN